MTLLFDQEAYRSLLVEFVPKVIETEEEHNRALAVVEQLTFKNNQTPEEQALYKLLVTLVEVYEDQNYALKKSAPHQNTRSGKPCLFRAGRNASARFQPPINVSCEYMIYW